MEQRAQPELAGIRRRLAALVYEALLLFAILFISGYLFFALAGRTPTGLLRWLFYIYATCICGAYLTYCWVRSGQTLAQKTWGLRVTAIDGSLLPWSRAALRFLLALISICSGIGLLWAVFDPERQFLHDRLSGSRIVLAKPRIRA